MMCAPIENLFALTQKSLPVDEAERLDLHLGTGCAVCQQRLHRIQQTPSVAKSCSLLDAPTQVTNQVMNLFELQELSCKNSRQVVPAVLLSDSGTEGRLLGFRSAGLTSRHLLYRAGQYDIDLSIDRVEPVRLFDIIGQSMPLGVDIEAVAHGHVELLKESAVTVTTSTNEFGEFILESLKEDVYDLKLRFRSEDINIVGLRVFAEEY